jgi:hypothetical protein
MIDRRQVIRVDAHADKSKVENEKKGKNDFDFDIDTTPFTPIYQKM